MMPADSTQAEIQAALDALRNGGIGAFPTETVYGLGADALNVEAIQRVFEIKGRPASHPLIVHLAHNEPLDLWARDIPAAAQRLAQSFWPGPLTLVLPKHSRVPAHVTGGQDSIALRVPQHPVAQTLLQAFGSGLVGPSANRFGALSPTSSQMVEDNLIGLDFILEGGACSVGIESTIVQVQEAGLSILRAGMISAASLQAVCELPLLSQPSLTRAPGQHKSHYAPSVPLVIVDLAELTALLPHISERRIGILGQVAAMSSKHLVIPSPPEPAHYAQSLYQNLRNLDLAHVTQIYVLAPPRTQPWQGIWDRLERAAS